jgi:UDP-N-acetylmuramoyl-L-alanyl-D-glutamate--2,6-diaminopimelate ligase
VSPAEEAGTGRHTVNLSLLVDRIRAAVAPGDVPGDLAGELGGTEISAVTFDHRDVVPGALHCCLPGARTDGRVFAAEALARGAAALLVEEALEGVEAPVVIPVPAGSSRAAMAAAACAFEGDPATALQMIGVTGTNGKTTVTHLCRSIFEAAGRPTAVVGTLSGVRTTPESPILQHLLADARDSGKAVVAMEVTSHALVQHRADGITFDVAVFTNLTQDHLDFHGTMEEYFAAKATLFEPSHARRGVVCSADPYGRRLLESASIPLTAYGLSDVSGVSVGAEESRFVLDGEEVRLHLGGSFNVLNALAAAAVARELGISSADVAAGLSAAEVVRGRFEAVANDRGIAVVVDYAHTPDALSAVLAAARDSAGADSQLILVFGCGGDRDRAKRPLMGRVATGAADIAIVTSDNPRSEDPSAIIDEILVGCDGPAKLLVEPDRRAAIGEALALARPGDFVVLAGKGHETTQEFADHTDHFDDREVAAGLLAAGGAGR